VTSIVRADSLHHQWLAKLADGFAIAAAATLPWSTSGTAITVGLWLVTALLIIDRDDLTQVLKTPAGALPVMLVVLAALGLLWADVSWAERWSGLTPFAKLLVLPLLMAQFRRSERGLWVLGAFLASCCLLLFASVATLIRPEVFMLRWFKVYGVPVKDYLTQSGEFIVCGFILLYLALETWRSRRFAVAAPSLLLAIAFFADVFFIATSRTTLLSIPFILVLFALRQFHWKAMIAVLACGLVAGVAIWASSEQVRMKLGNIVQEIEQYQSEDFPSSAGLRIIFWAKSISIVSDAPAFGHGTGSIGAKFAPLAKPGEGASSYVATNPHNQVLNVAIQLGLAGVFLVVAMWAAHLVLFWQPGLVAWIGLVVVAQNVIGSQLNSHLFDFTQGWLYVLGVGVAGGTMFRNAKALPAMRLSSLRATTS
jgi:O-antigen ligase